MMPATMKALEWYAVALAAVHHYRLASMEDIATHLRVTLAEWVAIDRAWTAALSAPGAAAARFAVLFAQTRKQLMEGRGPALADLPAYLGRLRPVPEASGSHGDETIVLAAAAAGGPVLPFAVARPSVEASTARGDATLVPATAASGPVLPFVVTRPASATVEPDGHGIAQPARATEEPEGHGTAILDAFVPGPALPFAREGRDVPVDGEGGARVT